MTQIKMSESWWGLDNEPVSYLDSKDFKAYCGLIATILRQARGPSTIREIHKKLGAAEWRDDAFAVVAATPQHTYQILTKRPRRMHRYVREAHTRFPQWPLPNVVLGVSVEDQATADDRIPILIHTPAYYRFLSIEPLLGPVDLSAFIGEVPTITGESSYRYSYVDQVIVGGESGPDARPMELEWVRNIRHQCAIGGTPFFFKQGSAANWQDFKNFSSFPKDLQVREEIKMVEASAE